VLIRRRLDESPRFDQTARDDVTRVPVTALLREYPIDVLRVTLGALASTVSTIFAVYALTFAVDTKGLDKTTMLWVAIVTNVVALAAIPAWAALADRIGRKPVFIFGALGSGALMFAYLAAIASGHYALIFLTAVLMSGVVYSAQNGVWPALYGEMFPTRVRLSGMAVGTQIGFAIGGFAPTAAAAIAGDGPGGWVPVAAYVLGFSILAVIGVATARETYDVTLDELDRRQTRVPQRTVASHRAPRRAGVA
jgi:MFS family permease